MRNGKRLLTISALIIGGVFAVDLILAIRSGTLDADPRTQWDWLRFRPKIVDYVR